MNGTQVFFKLAFYCLESNKLRTYPFLVCRLWIFRWGKRRFGSDIVEVAGVPTNEYGRPKLGFQPEISLKQVSKDKCPR